jgi:hypothetical protein
MNRVAVYANDVSGDPTQKIDRTAWSRWTTYDVRNQ